MRRFSQRSSLVTLSEINITPLLDLAFVLLIIFIITTPLLEQSINLRLPRGGIPDKPVTAQDVRTVEITREGVYLLGNGKGKPMVGKLIPTETIRPGVVSFALGFGHWATGASDLTIDEHTIRGEARRAAGIHANAAMWVDPDVKNTCLFDPVGGSVSFYDTWVTLERA